MIRAYLAMSRLGRALWLAALLLAGIVVGFFVSL